MKNYNKLECDKTLKNNNNDRKRKKESIQQENKPEIYKNKVLGVKKNRVLTRVLSLNKEKWNPKKKDKSSEENIESTEDNKMQINREENIVLTHIDSNNDMEKGEIMYKRMHKLVLLL